MLGMDGCQGGFPSALPGGHIQAVPEEIDAAIDVCKASSSSFLTTIKAKYSCFVELLLRLKFGGSVIDSLVLVLHFRESANPFVEQAIQFSIAAAKATITDKESEDALDKLLLQGVKLLLVPLKQHTGYII